MLATTLFVGLWSGFVLFRHGFSGQVYRMSGANKAGLPNMRRPAAQPAEGLVAVAARDELLAALSVW